MIDIITLPIVIENKKIDSRHRLCILAAQRARHLIQSTTSSPDTKYEEATTIALEELLENKVAFVSGKDAVEGKKEAKRVKSEELRTWARMAKEGELVTEIKKDLSVSVDDSGIEEGAG